MGNDMKPVDVITQVMGPPTYGSPDPATAVSRLVPLQDHPLHPDNLPEGSEVAISPDFGLIPVDDGNATPIPNGTTLSDGEDDDDDAEATEAAVDFANENDVDLDDVTGTGKDGRVTKGDVEKFVADRDAD